MLISFTVENFKSFNQQQEFTMIPNEKIHQYESHLIKLDNLSLLRNATIYGANGSGKTNLIEAMRFARYVITGKIPDATSQMYCRTVLGNEEKDTKFEFEICKNDKYYAYGFSINMKEKRIATEWLYQLFPENDDQMMLFEREIEGARVDLGEINKLSERDKLRFEVYRDDFGSSGDRLFIQEMNRGKEIVPESKLYFFKEVYQWFKEDLTIIYPNDPITGFEYFDDDASIVEISKLITLFDTGVSEVKLKEITLADFQSRVSKDLIENIFEAIEERAKDLGKRKAVRLSFRTLSNIYSLEKTKGEDIKIKTIVLRHKNSLSEFEFSEESDGTRRLFDLLDIIMNKKKNKVYVIDELNRSLHPNLTYRFVELFFESLEGRHIQLIFTTHEPTIMDQNLLRRDEVWFVDRDKNNVSSLYSLDRFKERENKKDSIEYLAGRYGAVPVLEKEFDEE